jgi:hypothetical protein
MGLVDQYGQQLATMGNLERQLVSAPQTVLDDPMAAYFYLYRQRDMLLQSIYQRPLLRLWDHNMQPIGRIGQENSCTVEEVMADSGSGSVVIRNDNWLSKFIQFDRRAEQDLHFTLDPYPTQRNWRTRWGGKVTTVNAKRDASGLHTVELELIHNREHLKHLLVGANPIFPPEIQVPKMYFLPWNVRSGVFMTLFLNLARQYFPLLAIPDNIGDPFAWAGISEAFGGLDPLLWPIQPQFVNMALDTSRFEVIAARWNDAHTVTLPVLTDAGAMIRAYTYIANEDMDSPHPELEALLGTSLKPERNAIILACEDKSNTGGLTGTLADGPIKMIAATGDSLITDTIVPDPSLFPDTEVPSGIYPLIQTWFGVAPKPPWIIWKDDQHSGIIESERNTHGATAKTIWTGGKSPGWVNSLQTFLIKWGLSQIQTVFTGGQFGQVGPAPLGAGLDEIYQGEADDTLLAYEKYSDPVRMLYMGDVDQLWSYKRSYDRSTAMRIDLQIGSGQQEQDPLLQATNSLAAMWNMVGMYMGSSQLF